MIQSAAQLTRAANDLWRGIERADRAAAQRRVDALRKRHPRLSRDELHRMLLFAKCVEVGAISAVAAATSSLPLIGPAVGAVIGPLADTTVISTLQAETIVETFAVYDIALPPRAEQAAILAIAATHLGARQAGAMVAKRIVQEATRVAGGSIAARLLPVTRIVALVAGDVALTYAIGTRSAAVAKMKDAKLEEWPDLLRQISMVDERRFTEWAGKAMRSVFDNAQELTGSLFERVGSLWSVPMAAPKPLPVNETRAAPPRRRAAAKPAGTGKPPAARKRKPARTRAKREPT